MNGMTVLDKKAELELDVEPYFEDDGCEVSPACLSCPLSKCKHDDPQWYRSLRKHYPEMLIYSEMQRDNLSPSAAAFRCGMKVRTIARIKARVKREIASGTDIASGDLGIVASIPAFGHSRLDLRR